MDKDQQPLHMSRRSTCRAWSQDIEIPTCTCLPSLHNCPLDSGMEHREDMKSIEDNPQSRACRNGLDREQVPMQDKQGEQGRILAKGHILQSDKQSIMMSMVGIIIIIVIIIIIIKIVFLPCCQDRSEWEGILVHCLCKYYLDNELDEEDKESIY